MIQKLLGETRSTTLRRIDARAVEEFREEQEEAATRRPWPDERDVRPPYLWRRIGRLGGGGS